MNLKLEAIVIPVSDVDRAKKFYQEALGFRVDVDHRAAVYEQALGFRHRSELSHCAADAAGIGMLDSDRKDRPLTSIPGGPTTTVSSRSATWMATAG